MLTKKEFCQYILANAQKKYNKKMTDLDLCYAEPEVGLALKYLGMVSADRPIENSAVFTHTTGKQLTYAELLDLLPENELSAKIDKSQLHIEGELSAITPEQVRDKLGERKYYRILDAFEHLKVDELTFVLYMLKEKLLTCFQ